MTRLAPHPSVLEVDSLKVEIQGREGRLLLCSAPGRPEPDQRSGSLERTAVDLAWLQKEAGAQILVCLLQDHELVPLVDLPGTAMAAGLDFRHLPIPDGMIPLDAFNYGCEVLRLAKALAEGRSVAIHCWMGMGRTGTLAASVLQACGLTPQEALRTVRKARPGSVANALQEAFLIQIPDVLNEVRTTKAKLREEVAGPKAIEQMELWELREELYEARRLLRDLTERMRR